MADLEAQLIQLHKALAVAGEEDKEGILALIEDLQGLIGNLQAEQLPNADESGVSVPFSDADDEFLRFQEEIRSMESSSSAKDDSAQPEQEIVSTALESSSSLNEELGALVGMSCKAPFMIHWGQVGYYNAVVFSVEPINFDSDDEVLSVRVIFTQPLSAKMKTCPYFLSGTCRFEEDCKFSHGEVVPLSHLKDYHEPDFSTLTKGSRVLAKYSDELWYHAVISSVTDSGTCDLTYENYGQQATVPLHDTQPLYDDQDKLDDTSSSCGSSDSDTETDTQVDEEPSTSTEETPIVWVHMRGTSALGLWEQHTKGMGSKLMAKMGYVFGSGLGKNSEGRVEPVDAVILPPGRSLDTVMKLKEKAGGNTTNLFSAERQLKRLQRRQKEKEAKLKSREAESQSMFNFLNQRLNLSKNRGHDGARSSAEVPNDTTSHKDANKSLGKQLISVSNRIREVVRDIAKCRQSIERHQGRDQTTVDRVKEKLTFLESQLVELKHSETKINTEQQHRHDKKKLTIF